jgi:hypothetical protein
MISEVNKNRARGHMGYLQVQQASTFFLGVPAGVQSQFPIEMAWSKILPSAEDRFVWLLDRLDELELQVVDNSENVEVESVDEIKINPKAFSEFIKRYQYWQGSLGNLLGIPPNPYDMRPFLGAGWSGNGGGVNVSVQH